MKTERIEVNGIPALIWGEPSESVYLVVHGKMSCKEDARFIAEKAIAKGYQILSFDLPEHGERKNNTTYRCDVWNGVRDVTDMADFAFRRWKNVCLAATSLGAYFSLHAFTDETRFPLNNVVFMSPILDMNYLVHQMFIWFDVTEEKLQAAGEIPTPVDPLRWDYYQYIQNHPTTTWPYPTSILYGGKDTMQSYECIRKFADQFGAKITLSLESEHPFMETSDMPVVSSFLEKNL